MNTNNQFTLPASNMQSDFYLLMSSPATTALNNRTKQNKKSKLIKLIQSKLIQIKISIHTSNRSGIRY